MTIFCKLHVLHGKSVLACCDQELTGKTVRDGEIEFSIRESFYKGKKVDKTELKQRMEEADSINLVGKKTVAVALENKWIKKEDIITIDKIPHVQIFKI